jgi:hypothetical protein
MTKEDRRGRRKDKVSIEGSSVDKNILLNKISALFDKCLKTALTGRVRDQKMYNLRLKELRILSYAAGVINGIQQQSEVAEVMAKLDALDKEEALEVAGIEG